MSINSINEHAYVESLVETKFSKAQFSFLLSPGGVFELKRPHFVSIVGDCPKVYTLMMSSEDSPVNQGEKSAVYKVSSAHGDNLHVLVMKTAELGKAAVDSIVQTLSSRIEDKLVEGSRLYIIFRTISENR